MLKYSKGDRVRVTKSIVDEDIPLVGKEFTVEFSTFVICAEMVKLEGIDFHFVEQQLELVSKSGGGRGMFDVINVGDVVTVRTDAKEVASPVKFNNRGEMDHLLGLDVTVADTMEAFGETVYFINDPKPENDGGKWLLSRSQFITKYQKEAVMDTGITPDSSNYKDVVTSSNGKEKKMDFKFGTQVLLNIPKGDTPLKGWGEMENKQDEVGLVISVLGDQLLIAFPTQLFGAYTSEVKVVGNTFNA